MGGARLWPTLFLTALAGVLIGAAPAAAQEVRDYGTSSRGLVGGGDAIRTALDLLAQTASTCDATDARRRGQDARGNPHYELACANGPGLYIVTWPEVTAISCMALAARTEPRAPFCRLPANRNPLVQYRRAAAAAGVTCEADRGRYIGHTPGGAEIYEIGCDGLAGGWVVWNPGDASFKSCLIVEVEGGTCTLTSATERLATAAQLLRGSSVETCAPVEARFMGASAGIQHYEVRCRAGEHVVARLPREGGAPDIIPCEAATLIGGGCRFTP